MVRKKRENKSSPLKKGPKKKSKPEPKPGLESVSVPVQNKNTWASVLKRKQNQLEEEHEKYKTSAFAKHKKVVKETQKKTNTNPTSLKYGLMEVPTPIGHDKLETKEVDSKQEHNTVDIGLDFKLPYKYILWYHDIHDNNWGIESYHKMCEITNASEFWKLFNNFEKIGFYNRQFFLMKDNIQPIWEHESNRHGGVFSFKIDTPSSYKVWEDLNMTMVCDKLSSDCSDINGLSINPKNNWAIIKIWNRDSNKDFENILANDVKSKYSYLSMKYKANSPEY